MTGTPAGAVGIERDHAVHGTRYRIRLKVVVLPFCDDLDGIVDPTVKSFFSLTFIKTGYVTDRSKSFEFTTTKIQRIDHRMRRE